MLGREQSPDARREAARLSSVEATLNRMQRSVLVASGPFAAKPAAGVAHGRDGQFRGLGLAGVRRFRGGRCDAGRGGVAWREVASGPVVVHGGGAESDVFYWLGTNYLAMILWPAILSAATYLSWLRVSLGLHTLNQVIVGAAVGSAFGALWFVLWHSLVQEALACSPLLQNAVILGSAVFYVGFSIVTSSRMSNGTSWLQWEID